MIILGTFTFFSKCTLLFLPLFTEGSKEFCSIGSRFRQYLKNVWKIGLCVYNGNDDDDNDMRFSHRRSKKPLDMRSDAAGGPSFYTGSKSHKRSKDEWDTEIEKVTEIDKLTEIDKVKGKEKVSESYT